MATIKFLGLTFKLDTIFSKRIREITLSSLLKNKNKKTYHVVEFTPDYYLLEHHFIHAIKILKVNYEQILKIVRLNEIIVINNNQQQAIVFYQNLKKLGYKKVYILKQN